MEDAVSNSAIVINVRALHSQWPVTDKSACIELMQTKVR